MKKLLLAFCFLLSSFSLMAQQLSPYETTRENRVLSDRAKEALYFLGLPGRLALPNYVPDSLKARGLWMVAGSLYKYSTTTHAFELIAVSDAVNRHYADSLYAKVFSAAHSASGVWNFTTLRTTGNDGNPNSVVRNVDLPGSASPTATAGASAVNGSATTYMRSDAAPKIDSGVFATMAKLLTYQTKAQNLSTFLKIIDTGSTFSNRFITNQTAVTQPGSAFNITHGTVTNTNGRAVINFTNPSYGVTGGIGFIGNPEMLMHFNMDYQSTPGVHKYFNPNDVAIWMPLGTSGFHIQFANSHVDQTGAGDVVLTTQGLGYVDGVYNTLFTGGHGTGANTHIVVSGGHVISQIRGFGGTGYQVGDVLSVDSTAVGGAGHGFTATVNNLYNDIWTGSGEPYMLAIDTLLHVGIGKTAISTGSLWGDAKLQIHRDATNDYASIGGYLDMDIEGDMRKGTSGTIYLNKNNAGATYINRGGGTTYINPIGGVGGQLSIGTITNTTAATLMRQRGKLSGSLMLGLAVQDSLTATANNQTLIGNDFATVFNDNSFTGVTHWEARLFGNVQMNGGLLNLNNATSNLLLFGSGGLGAPTFTTRSLGMKVVIGSAISGSAADYGFGLEFGALDYVVPSTSQSHKFYAGTTNVATLSGLGVLTITGGLTAATTIPTATALSDNTGIANTKYVDDGITAFKTAVKTLTNTTLTAPILNTTSVVGQVWTATNTAGAGAWANGGGTVTSITPGYGFTSATPITSTGTMTIDSSKLLTVLNLFPKTDTRYPRYTYSGLAQFDYLMYNGTVWVNQHPSQNANVSQGSVLGSTSGSLLWSEPVFGTADKKVIISCSALVGTASIVFTNAFSITPTILSTNGPPSSVVTSISTTGCTITGSSTTGTIILEGY